MNLFFDAAAAAPCPPAVLEELTFFASEQFANQEAMGAHSVRAAAAVRVAEDSLCAALCASAADASCFWTSTGTEALNSAVFLLPKLFPNGGAILCSGGEHAALTQALSRLSGHFRIVTVKTCPDGRIDLDDLRRNLSKSVILLAVHHVQPETGVIQNLPEIRNLLIECGSKALFLSDTIQSACRVPIPWKEARLDFATLSGAKIGVPCGAALLFRPHFLKQVQMLRREHLAGRLSPACCLLLNSRVSALMQTLNVRSAAAGEQKEFLRNELIRLMPGVFRETVSPENASPYLLHLLFSGVKGNLQGAILSRILSSKGVSVAPGSACDAETKDPSRVLTAMGIPREEAFTALRISWLQTSPFDDLKNLARLIADAVNSY